MVDLLPVQFLFHAIPEDLLLTYVGLGLLGIKTKFINYIKISLVSVVGLWLVRNVLNLYGFHILFNFLILALAIKVILEINFKVAVIASLLGYIGLTLGELIFLPLLLNVFNVDLQTINQNLREYFIAAYVCMSPLMITAVAIYYFDFKLIDLGGGGSER